MSPFSEQEIAASLGSLPGWQHDGGELTRTFHFKDFRTALAFVDQVGECAERADHHPDVDIRYNRVRLGLATHDAGGITARDFDLAAAVEKLIVSR